MRIRPVSLGDASAIANIYAPFVTSSHTSFETEAPDSVEFEKRIASSITTYPWLVAESNNIVCGYAYATQHRLRAAYRWSVDVSVYIAPDFSRQGVGKNLYKELFEVLRLQGFKNAYAGVALPNDASVRLHESLGFKLVGIYHSVGFKNGAWHDVGWWELELSSKNEKPDEPLPFSRFQYFQNLSHDDFVNAFEECSIPDRLWTHKAHVRLAWVLLNRFSFEESLHRVRSGIKRYINSLGAEGKYNETVTYAYMKLISQRIQKQPEISTWEQFVVKNTDFFDRSFSPLLAFYSKETLLSDSAREKFITPDLKNFDE